MFKKYLSYLGVLVLACFSFYYTDRAVDIVKRNDPIMKSIIASSDDYYVESVSAIVDGDEIIPGLNGKKINISKSYQKMKNYNIFDESMFVFSDVFPDISLNNNYDKYIVSGNKLKKQIALLFKVDDFSYINYLNNILVNKDAKATLFIDGSIIENHIEDIVLLSELNYEIENLGYDLEYSNEKIGWTNNLISSITNSDVSYCYTDYKNDIILSLCSKYKMYTVKPNIIINNFPFLTIKNNLDKGNIISFNINNDVLKELPTIISYLRQKGYELVTLNELLSEKNMVEK